MAAKFDTELANQVLIWMKEMINSNLAADEQPVDFDTSGDMQNFADILKDGVILARYICSSPMDTMFLPRVEFIVKLKSCLGKHT